MDKRLTQAKDPGAVKAVSMCYSTTALPVERNEKFELHEPVGNGGVIQ